MKLKIYSIYDTAAKSFAQPFFLHTDAVAIRAFKDNVNSPDSVINKNPEQFTLYTIGLFDDSQGTILAEASPEPIINAAQLIDEQHADKYDLLKQNIDDFKEFVKVQLNITEEI